MTRTEYAIPEGKFGTNETIAELLRRFPTATRGKRPGLWHIPGGTAITTCRTLIIKRKAV